MRKVVVGVWIVLGLVTSGCATDDLDSLSLVSAQDVAIQKRDAGSQTPPVIVDE